MSSLNSASQGSSSGLFRSVSQSLHGSFNPMMCRVFGDGHSPMVTDARIEESARTSALWRAGASQPHGVLHNNGVEPLVFASWESIIHGRLYRMENHNGGAMCPLVFALSDFRRCELFPVGLYNSSLMCQRVFALLGVHNIVAIAAHNMMTRTETLKLLPLLSDTF